MKKLILFIQIFLLFNFSAFTQQVIIKGNAKSYAGEELVWYCYDDQISFNEKELARTSVKNNGDFVFTININETILSFIHLNVFKGILYIEPNKDYEIILPQKVNKLPEDELNPFFEETEFHIRVFNADENELNEMIKNFNRLYDNYLTKYFQQFKGKLNKAIADTIIESIEKSIPNNSNNYFNDYKYYSYASLKLISYERNKEKLTESSFTNKPILYQNPAYMDLFNQLYTNYLAYYSKTRQGKQIPYLIVKERSLSKLKIALNENPSLQNEAFQELIICKSLYDNFYKDDYPRESIICVLDSIRANGNSENRKVADNLYKKVTALLPDFPAPDFELHDNENNIRSLANFRDKFVYLNFVNPESYTCIQELEVLKKMDTQHIEMLEIVTICVCDNVEKMKKLILDNGYPWPFLFFDMKKDLLKAYNIRTYPTYYLLNPEGKLTMSPAFPPTEPSFMNRYSDILKAWKIQMEQKKNKGKGSNN